MLVIYSLAFVSRLTKRYSSTCKTRNPLLKIVLFSSLTADQYKEELTRDAFINGLSSPWIFSNLKTITYIELSSYLTVLTAGTLSVLVNGQSSSHASEGWLQFYDD